MLVLLVGCVVLAENKRQDIGCALDGAQSCGTRLKPAAKWGAAEADRLVCCGLPQAGLVVIRGGGDLATGVVQKLWRVGFAVLVLETRRPSAIRRTVCVSEAIYKGYVQVEDVPAYRASDLAEALALIAKGKVAVLVDEELAILREIEPLALVDATLAKRNLGLRAELCGHTIALGPGFTAPRDAHIVIETQRGHSLGKLIFAGQATLNTGVPGEIMGWGAERVLRAPAQGAFRPLCTIGSVVAAGECVATVAGQDINAPFTGLIRGLLPSGFPVEPGFKCGDLDPRSSELANVYAISDKARALGGAVLEALLLRLRGRV